MGHRQGGGRGASPLTLPAANGSQKMQTPTQQQKQHQGQHQLTAQAGGHLYGETPRHL